MRTIRNSNCLTQDPSMIKEKACVKGKQEADRGRFQERNRPLTALFRYAIIFRDCSGGRQDVSYRSAPIPGSKTPVWTLRCKNHLCCLTNVSKVSALLDLRPPLVTDSSGGIDNPDIECNVPKQNDFRIVLEAMKVDLLI